MDVTRERIEYDPVIRVVELSPDEAGCGDPAEIYRVVQDDMFAEAGQLAVPEANTVLPRTVASTTGNAASAARPKKMRRSISTFSSAGTTAFGSSRS